MSKPEQITTLRLKSRPTGRVKETDLQVKKEPVPALQEGQCLVQNVYISLDPTHRIWMSDIPQYMDPVNIGDVMRAMTIGKVIESKNPDFPVGTYVSGSGGIADYFVGIPGQTVFFPVSPDKVPLSTYGTVLSMIIGLTAWYGTRKILEVKEGDIVLVSGAAGAVGSLVGQLAKVQGAKVIGVAGGPTKCQKLTDYYGFDVAIDYKSQNVSDEIKNAAPDGITCYFDNVGGEVSEAALANFQNYGRYCLCGSISEYEDKWSGIKNFNMLLMRRITLRGFICSDHAEHFGECVAEISDLITKGQIKYDEDIRKVGLEQYVSTLNDLFDGKNTGKLLMQIADE